MLKARVNIKLKALALFKENIYKKARDSDEEIIWWQTRQAGREDI